jgi:uncharacterized protein
MNKGMVHVFGPVFDPKGAYGLGIVSADSEEELNAFLNNDPSLAFNTIEFHEMRAVMP